LERNSAPSICESELKDKEPPTIMGQQITNRRLVRHQILIVILLMTGYAGFYACRSNFSVTLPLIIDD